MSAAREFYVGYLPQAPPALARTVRARVLLFLGLGLAGALLITAFQQPFSKAVFEFGKVRSFEGRIEVRPYPMLVVERPGAGDASRYLLVAFGKHGAEAEVGALAGRRVRLEGSLVYRDDQTMIELAEGSVEALDDSVRPEPSPSQAVDSRTFVGEIVDSKCFLGVMKPGNLKPHRACATRCISGGIPPILLVTDAEGLASYLLLTDAQGGPVGAEVVARGLVAEPVRITGAVHRLGDLRVLRADPSAWERIE